jgi:hypothetical protein
LVDAGEIATCRLNRQTWRRGASLRAAHGADIFHQGIDRYCIFNFHFAFTLPPDG